jgi:tetratricopeptide (TPR) repeat protein
LQQRILAGEQVPEAPEPLRTVPRMLPAGIRDFTGRAEQLKLLDGLLPATEGGAMPIVALAGTAGAGKTALAVHWAHQVADRFPDGQLYVNLRGFSPAGHPLPVGEAVRRFLDALGVPAERVPADLDAQADLYRTQLADRRMLVVLDNAADEEQVRPLLPASRGCMVLVTSRSRLQGLVAAEAAYPIGLELLGDAEAELLLIRRLGHDRVAAEPEAVGELVERCARLPLALAIVAARAATSADLSLRAIAAHLGEDENLDVFSGTDPVTDLRVVFSWSLDHVTPAAGRLFRLLGLDPGTEIGVPATASLAGVPVEDVRPLLAELCDAHLLIELTPGRYAFHDLLCAYAYELATTQEPEAEQRAGARRVFDHYLYSAISAAVALDPLRNPPAFDDPEPGTTPEHFDDAAEAWEWFTTERPSLLEAIQEAGEYGLDTHGWHLAMAIADYFFRAGHWHDQLSSQRAALAAAHRLADLKLQGVSYRVMARSLIRLGRFEQACDQLRQGLRLSAEAGDRANQAFLEYNLGFAMSEWGRHEEAVDHTRRAIDLYDAVGNREGGASARSQLGWELAQLGDYEGALRHCEQALAEQEELDDEFTQPETLISLGYIHHQLGDYPRATDCYSRALQGFRKLGNRYLEADTLKHLGDTQLAMGDRETARASWQEALAILDDLGHSDAEQVRARLAG